MVSGKSGQTRSRSTAHKNRVPGMPKQPRGTPNGLKTSRNYYPGGFDAFRTRWRGPWTLKMHQNMGTTNAYKIVHRKLNMHTHAAGCYKSSAGKSKSQAQMLLQGIHYAIKCQTNHVMQVIWCTGAKYTEIHCGVLQKYTPYNELVPELGKTIQQ